MELVRMELGSSRCCTPPGVVLMGPGPGKGEVRAGGWLPGEGAGDVRPRSRCRGEPRLGTATLKANPTPLLLLPWWGRAVSMQSDAACRPGE